MSAADTDDDDTLDLTIEADAVRASLIHTLDELGQRRHDLLDVPHQVRAHLRPVLAACALGLFAAGAGVALLVHRMATAKVRRRRERWLLLQRVWTHPERVAQTGGAPSLWVSVGRTVLLGLVSRAMRRI